MRVLIDTNVVLDHLLNRAPFADEAEEIISACITGSYSGVITTTSVTDLFYIAGKHIKDLHQLYLLLEELFERVDLCGVTNGDIMMAMDQKELDFEDCLQSVCAQREGCDVIITRNIKDFKHSRVRAMTPEEFLREFRSYFKSYDRSEVLPKS